MLPYNINEKYIKKDSWVKDLRKTFSPELLANLIQKRIEFPSNTGPYIRSVGEEHPVDIIIEFLNEDAEYRRKLTPAIGLLLYKLLYKQMTESHEIMRGLFLIIRNSKLVECHKLVYSWLKANFNLLVSVDQRWKITYRDGLFAYAQIQDKDDYIKDWWLGLWKEGSSFWWIVSFFGLRIQDPALACQELPLLINRNIDKTNYILIGAWMDLEARPLIERSIRKGINENTGWAGYALNSMLEKLTEIDKNKLMANIKIAI